jgi:hypothetical protein
MAACLGWKLLSCAITAEVNAHNIKRQKALLGDANVEVYDVVNLAVRTIRVISIKKIDFV